MNGPAGGLSTSILVRTGGVMTSHLSRTKSHLPWKRNPLFSSLRAAAYQGRKELRPLGGQPPRDHLQHSRVFETQKKYVVGHSSCVV